MAGVTLRGVRKTYPGGVEAVKGISLEIEDGEFLVLVGPSGCGKSTTLRMIAGLEGLSEGDILIGDTSVAGVAPKDRDIAMVFQNYALYPHMTVYKNMAFGLKLRGFPKADIDRRVREAADILGIGDLLERRPKALSGGQRQRVAVGRAIVRNPKVFLFDEPLSNLDAKLRVQMRAEITKLHRQLRTTMVYVTHDQVEAMTMGDRIVVMHDGEIQQVDTPLNLYNRPANTFVAGFIGSPAMNLLTGTVIGEQGGFVFRDASESLHLRVPESKHSLVQPYLGQEVVLGIRPEDVHAQDAGAVSDGMTIGAAIEVAEPMGAETNLYLNLGGRPFVARLKPDPAHAEEQEILLRVDMDRAHFFDAGSGAALREEALAAH